MHETREYMKKMILVFIITTLSMVMIPSLVFSSYSENDIQSPKKQIESGVLPEDIRCKENRVLVMRTSDIPACVTEKTALRLGWEIINNFKQEPEPSETKPDTKKISSENNIGMIEEKIPWLYGVEDLSYMELEKIPNPTGYWVPVEDKDGFAELLANATGAKIIEKTTRYDKFMSIYTTEHGGIIFHNRLTNSPVNPPVLVSIYKSIDSGYNQNKFINNFMDKMGFKIGEEHILTQCLFDSCEINFAFHECEFEDNVTIRKQFTGDRTNYTILQPYSNIQFVFYDESFVKHGSPGIKIKFHGWTNDPKLVPSERLLDFDKAVKIAHKFASTNEELNKSSDEGGKCEGFAYDVNSEYINVSDKIISGVPFYFITIASCTYDPSDTGHQKIPLILVDAWTGENVFLTYHGGLD